MYCQASQSTASRAKNNQPKSNKNIQLLISHGAKGGGIHGAKGGGIPWPIFDVPP
jgi:hypothetical protein